MLFQEQSSLSNLSVRENVFLGHEEQFIRFGHDQPPGHARCGS